MTGINKARSGLYRWARILGDVQAVERSVQTGSPAPVARRLLRKRAGPAYGKAIGKILR